MMVLMNVEEVLADLGCTTISVAATVEDALALLETETFDAAMLDVNLGGQPSFHVGDALAQRCIPFVFSTGYGEHGIEARFSARPVLKKPYSDQQLASALAGLLAGDEIVTGIAADAGTPCSSDTELTACV